MTARPLDFEFGESDRIFGFVAGWPAGRRRRHRRGQCTGITHRATHLAKDCRLAGVKRCKLEYLLGEVSTPRHGDLPCGRSPTIGHAVHLGRVLVVLGEPLRGALHRAAYDGERKAVDIGVPQHFELVPLVEGARAGLCASAWSTGPCALAVSPRRRRSRGEPRPARRNRRAALHAIVASCRIPLPRRTRFDRGSDGSWPPQRELVRRGAAPRGSSSRGAPNRIACLCCPRPSAIPTVPSPAQLPPGGPAAALSLRFGHDAIRNRPRPGEKCRGQLKPAGAFP
jgi:hypothetical protein